MNLDTHFNALISSDKAAQVAARQALVDAGAAAVEAVMEHLRDEASPVDWSDAGWILRQIGDPALPALVDTIAGDVSPEVRRRAAWTLNALNVSGPDALAPAFSHPSPQVRECAAVRVQFLGAAGFAYLDLILTLLGDEDEDVRQRVVWALSAIGEQTVPVLTAVRRSPSAGVRRRATALQALAEIGGRDVLDARDKAAVSRLIRIKQKGEIPEPMHLCGSWYAVPARPEHEVMEAFGLSDPVPVTMRLGASAWNHDHHAYDHRIPHAKHRRVYVSPELDGWRLVFGSHSDDNHAEDRDAGSDGVDPALVKARCAELSTRFGAARWYGMSCGDSWTAWCIAEKGEVLRYYDVYDADEHDDEADGDDADRDDADRDDAAESILVGTGHPAEAGFVLPHEDPFPPDAFDGVDYNDSEAFQQRWQQVKDDLQIPDECDGAIIAGLTSVDPSELGPHTRVKGSGWLAMTECGRVHGDAPGALQI
ncbi:HEAT repeat domain-containing protein [Actinospica robiniae]|uniref:HEAT repeat domain-containing protein n=1 Tax=Actinospica robiniae TaxID=304901 RepID=UPI0004043EF4|nr:HEAT repeat domain-containing protein [Actinospica robiniae]